MPDRETVYAAIDQEREYQNALPPSRTDGKSHSVGDYITMLSYYLKQAEMGWACHAGQRAALHGIRKVAGIAVRCMEEHGAPERGSAQTDLALQKEQEGPQAFTKPMHGLGEEGS